MSASNIVTCVPSASRTDHGDASNLFVKELATEPDWYSLGYLLNVPKYRLDTINIEHRISGGRRCLIEVFDYLYKEDKSPSWGQVVDALQTMGKKQRAKEISNKYGIILPTEAASSSVSGPVLTPSSSLEESDDHRPSTEGTDQYDVLVSKTVSRKYKELIDAFTRLVLHVRKALETNVQVEELQIVADQMLGLDPLPQEEATFAKVFTRLLSKLSALNYSCIDLLVKEFARENTKLQREFIRYEKLYKEFEKSAKMKELKQLILHSQEVVGKGKPVRLKLRGHWGERLLKNFNRFLRSIMSDVKCVKLRVTEGCICVSWEVPNVPSSEIIKPLARSAEFMSAIGVLSLKVGEEVVFEKQDQVDDEESSLETFFVSAVKAGQMEAACVLLAVSDDPFSLISSKHLEKESFKKLCDSNGHSVLHWASSKGFTEVVEAILSMEGFPPDIPDKNGWTPLMVAINTFHIDTVKQLIVRANVSICNKDGTSPVYLASQTSQAVIAYSLLQAGADPRVAKKNGMTPLMIASKNGSSDIVRLLIENEKGLDAKNDQGMTALNFASTDGHSEVVSLLIESGANPEMPNDRGYTPLMSASEKGFSKVVDVLAPKVNVTYSSKNGLTALHRASMLGHTIVVSTLLLSGADPLAKVKPDEFTPFLYACKKGHDAVINTILQLSKPDLVPRLIEDTTRDGKTGLYYVSRKGCKSAVKTLLKKGADPNKGDDSGSTPLMAASYKGFKDIVELLLKCKARVNDRHKKGTTALYLASDNCHTEVVRILLENVADPNLTELVSKKWSPLMVACEKGNIELVLLLLQYKAKINLQAVDGSTALHIATRKGHKEIVKALIDANVDTTLKNSKGQTARDVAIDKGLHRIAVMVDLESSDTGIGTLSTATRDGEQEDDDNINTFSDESI